MIVNEDTKVDADGDRYVWRSENLINSFSFSACFVHLLLNSSLLTLPRVFFFSPPHDDLMMIQHKSDKKEFEQMPNRGMLQLIIILTLMLMQMLLESVDLSL